MSLIPDEELRREKSLNLAPMVDFLFLVVAVLTTLAVTRSMLSDTELELVKVNSSKTHREIPSYNEHYLVNLSVTAKGAYKWVTDIDEYPMENPSAIQQELLKQVENGLLPKEKERTKVLLHIDKNAPWESVAQVIFAVKGSGFQIHPVYEPKT